MFWKQSVRYRDVCRYLKPCKNLVTNQDSSSGVWLQNLSLEPLSSPDVLCMLYHVEHKERCSFDLELCSLVYSYMITEEGLKIEFLWVFHFKMVYVFAESDWINNFFTGIWILHALESVSPVYNILSKRSMCIYSVKNRRLFDKNIIHVMLVRQIIFSDQYKLIIQDVWAKVGESTSKKSHYFKESKVTS